MGEQKITPNGGDSPCVCGAIHPCCRYLVDGRCPHRTPGDHHHAPTRTTLTDAEKLAAIRRLAESWHKGYDFYGRPWSQHLT